MSDPAVLYLRVSSAEQVAGTSLATQERDCRAACARLGLEVRAVFRDEGKSAKSTVGRDGLAAAMDECKRSGAALVVWKFDRLARNAADALSVRDILTAKGARIVSATEGEASASPMSKMVFGIASLVAEFDNSQRAERSRRGMGERADAGGWCFRAPVGFVLARTESGVPVLAPDEDGAAPAIRAAFSAIADGESDAARAVRDVAAATGKTRGTIYAALRSPIYKGVLPAGKLGPERPAAFPGLVAPEVWDAAQAKLDPRQLGRIHMKTNPHTPLVGVLFCGECGKALIGGYSTGKTGARFGYYRCRNCRGVSIRIEAAERAVRDELAVLAGSRDFLALVKANMEAWTALDGDPDAEAREVAAARRTIAKQEARLHRARAALVDGLFTPDEFEGFRRDCAVRLADARAIVEGREKWRARREGLVDALVEIAAAPERVMELPPASLRDGLRAVLGRVQLVRGKGLRFPPDCTAEILRSVQEAGCTGSDLAPLALRLLKSCGPGAISAARALRVTA